ncbi:MAG: site-specific DNA-methyltransferase, partial [Nanoarchaeota archaeon]
DFVPLLNKFGFCHLENWIILAHAKGRGASKHCKSLREDIFHATKHSKNFVWNNLKTLRSVIAPYVKAGRPRGWFLLDLPSEDNLSIIKHRVRWTGIGNIWHYSFPQHNSICERQLFSAQKPLMALERMIRLSSNENDIVLDPFMGSGSTALACKISNRQFIGFENNEEYYNMSQKRLKEFDITKFTEYNKNIDKLLKETNNK